MTDKPKKPTRPAIDDALIDHIANFEKYKPYFYLDSKDYVTIGEGFQIPDEASAARLPLRRMTNEDSFTNDPVTEKEIREAYRRVKNFKGVKNLRAEAYNPIAKSSDFMALGLAPEDSRKILKTLVAQSEESLKRKIRGFDDLPVPARQALIDMEYNMGDARFRAYKKDPKTGQMVPAWPNLFSAIDAQDWEKAAQEVESRDIGVDRNDWRRKRMLDASKE
jgi:GH24 family phage-related lysozyme (muramidase)